MYTESPQYSDSNPLEDRLDNLRQKLIGFEVVNQQNELVGIVENLIIDATQHLTFVLTRSLSDPLQKSFLLESRLVDRVNPKPRTLLVSLSPAGLANLPVYPMQSDASRDLIQSDNRLGSRHSLADPQAISAERNFAGTASAMTEQPTGTTPQEPLLPKLVEQDVVEQQDVLRQNVVQDETIRLLEERLKVNYQKQKVGEVVVRKEIETRMVQVPVRREKLIVEQVGDSPRRLAEIDLAQGEIEGLELLGSEVPSNHSITAGSTVGSTVRGEVSSPRTAAWLLDAIARQSNHGCKRIRIEIELDNPSHQETYQSWLDRCR
ncbi:MAG: PRC and DUF2382 domain-containing protein [Myxacorys chilensis ATA2-1-KO14]|nr:PRC and DUF2382 domain-containing protein [Myxacorys chilensis ATA2-1-KO14]